MTLGLDSKDLIMACTVGKMDKEVYTTNGGGTMEKDGLHLVTCCTRVTNDYDRGK